MATVVPAPAGTGDIAGSFARAGGLLGQGLGGFFARQRQNQALQQFAQQQGIQTPRNLPPQFLQQLLINRQQQQARLRLQAAKEITPPVNTPRFFVKEFGFTPKQAQAAAEVAKGIRPKTLDQLSSLELTRMAEVLQASASPAAFAVGQKIADIAAKKIEQELKLQKPKGITRPKTQIEFDAIPIGSPFIDTDGKRKTKR